MKIRASSLLRVISSILGKGGNDISTCWFILPRVIQVLLILWGTGLLSSGL